MESSVDFKTSKSIKNKVVYNRLTFLLIYKKNVKKTEYVEFHKSVIILCEHFRTPRSGV